MQPLHMQTYGLKKTLYISQNGILKNVQITHRNAGKRK